MGRLDRQRALRPAGPSGKYGAASVGGARPFRGRGQSATKVPLSIRRRNSVRFPTACATLIRPWPSSRSLHSTFARRPSWAKECVAPAGTRVHRQSPVSQPV